MTLNPNKICWAVDPFAERVMLQRSAAWAIHVLTQGRPADEVQPIYLVGQWPESLVPQRSKRMYLERLRAFAENSMKRITRGIPIENLKPVQVISGPFDSVEEGARTLVSAAKLRETDLIVASTRANRGGGGPFQLPGSFVESLANLSEIPLLTVNPSWRYATGIPSILFPSDLSYESYEWYLETLAFAKAMKAKVVLFQKITFPLTQPYPSAVRIFPELREVLYRKIKDSQAEAKRWVREGRKRGVRVSVVIDGNMVGSLTEAVLKRLKSVPGSVVIAPPISITYPRSTLLKLMMRSPYPMFHIPANLRRQPRAFAALEAA